MNVDSAAYFMVVSRSCNKLELCGRPAGIARTLVNLFVDNFSIGGLQTKRNRSLLITPDGSATGISCRRSAAPSQ
jgi:hypothetical protein